MATSFHFPNRDGRQRRLQALIALAAAGVVSAALAGSGQGSTSDGVFSQAQSDRGKAVFALNCAACHGADLSGDSTMQSPALAGDEFMKNWTAKSLDDLFDRIRTTMPANSPGSVPDDQVIDAIAYILDVNKFPAGTAELKANRDALKTVMLTRK
jgi:S-disulfanyl-L-cysteine oxidoreductase SoxD